jgi:Ca2+/Na+ antiporter
LLYSGRGPPPVRLMRHELNHSRTHRGTRDQIFLAHEAVNRALASVGMRLTVEQRRDILYEPGLTDGGTSSHANAWYPARDTHQFFLPPAAALAVLAVGAALAVVFWRVRHYGKDRRRGSMDIEDHRAVGPVSGRWPTAPPPGRQFNDGVFDNDPQRRVSRLRQWLLRVLKRLSFYYPSSLNEVGQINRPAVKSIKKMSASEYPTQGPRSRKNSLARTAAIMILLMSIMVFANSSLRLFVNIGVGIFLLLQLSSFFYLTITYPFSYVNDGRQTTRKGLSAPTDSSGATREFSAPAAALVVLAVVLWMVYFFLFILPVFQDSNFKHWEAVTTLNGTPDRRARKWRFSDTKRSTSAHSAYAAIKASAGLKPIDAYLTASSTGTTWSSSIWAMVWIKIINSLNLLGERLLRTSLIIVRGTQTKIRGIRSGSLLRRIFESEWASAPKVKMNWLVSMTSLKFFIPQLFPRLSQLGQYLGLGHFVKFRGAGSGKFVGPAQGFSGFLDSVSRIDLDHGLSSPSIVKHSMVYGKDQQGYESNGINRDGPYFPKEAIDKDTHEFSMALGVAVVVLVVGVVLFLVKKLFPRHLDIIQNRTQQAFSQVFTFVEWNDRRTAVWMTHINMASFLTNALKTVTGQYSQDFGRFKRSQSGHQLTSTSWIPTNLRGVIVGRSTSRHSWMASLTRFNSVARVLAWVWHPFKAGTVAIRTSSSSFSITTKNGFLFIIPYLLSSLQVYHDWFGASIIGFSDGINRGGPFFPKESTNNDTHEFSTAIGVAALVVLAVVFW